ncbi:protein transport protein Sec24A-like isoform X2 [Rhipicephalus microplus]|uniref:protein transport protein Sec24A-like isoform X2 n=1 Tax=Rhipicephalus microplus TaxID=6941 RepID=UPI003F6B4FD8
MGKRRIRVHTLCLPVTAMLQDILGSVDQEAVKGMLCKMAVDRSLSSSVVDDERQCLMPAWTLSKLSRQH